MKKTYWLLISLFLLTLLTVGFASCGLTAPESPGNSQTSEKQETVAPILPESQPDLPSDTEPETVPETDPPANLYDFSKPVPEGTPVTVDWFRDTLFIGDSRTVGMILYSDLAPIDCTSVGLSVTKLKNAYIPMEDGSAVSCMDMLWAKKGQYKAVYISLGVNELGWDADTYITYYGKMLDDIRAVTNVPIYIQLVLPVTNEYAAASPYGISNANVTAFNEKLRAVAAEKQVFLLDPYAYYALADGSLNPDYTTDGAHLTVTECRNMVDFYCRHVVDFGAYDNIQETHD